MQNSVLHLPYSDHPLPLPVTSSKSLVTMVAEPLSSAPVNHPHLAPPSAHPSHFQNQYPIYHQSPGHQTHINQNQPIRPPHLQSMPRTHLPAQNDPNLIRNAEGIGVFLDPAMAVVNDKFAAITNTFDDRLGDLSVRWEAKLAQHQQKIGGVQMQLQQQMKVLQEEERSRYEELQKFILEAMKGTNVQTQTHIPNTITLDSQGPTHHLNMNVPPYIPNQTEIIQYSMSSNNTSFTQPVTCSFSPKPPDPPDLQGARIYTNVIPNLGNTNHNLHHHEPLHHHRHMEHFSVQQGYSVQILHPHTYQTPASYMNQNSSGSHLQTIASMKFNGVETGIAQANPYHGVMHTEVNPGLNGEGTHSNLHPITASTGNLLSNGLVPQNLQGNQTRIPGGFAVNEPTGFMGGVSHGNTGHMDQPREENYNNLNSNMEYDTMQQGNNTFQQGNQSQGTHMNNSDFSNEIYAPQGKVQGQGVFGQGFQEVRESSTLEFSQQKINLNLTHPQQYQYGYLYPKAPQEPAIKTSPIPLGKVTSKTDSVSAFLDNAKAFQGPAIKSTNQQQRVPPALLGFKSEKALFPGKSMESFQQKGPSSLSFISTVPSTCTKPVHDIGNALVPASTSQKKFDTTLMTIPDEQHDFNSSCGPNENISRGKLQPVPLPPNPNMEVKSMIKEFSSSGDFDNTHTPARKEVTGEGQKDMFAAYDSGVFESVRVVMDTLSYSQPRFKKFIVTKAQKKIEKARKLGKNYKEKYKEEFTRSHLLHLQEKVKTLQGSCIFAQSKHHVLKGIRTYVLSSSETFGIAIKGEKLERFEEEKVIPVKTRPNDRGEELCFVDGLNLPTIEQGLGTGDTTSVLWFKQSHLLLTTDSSQAILVLSSQPRRTQSPATTRIQVQWLSAIQLELYLEWVDHLKSTCLRSTSLWLRKVEKDFKEKYKDKTNRSVTYSKVEDSCYSITDLILPVTILQWHIAWRFSIHNSVRENSLPGLIKQVIIWKSYLRRGAAATQLLIAWSPSVFLEPT